MASPPTDRHDFEIAIICALPLEYDAVSILIDQSWDQHGYQYGRAVGDLNTYSTGRMGSFDVVLVLLPEMGTITASSSAATIRSSFPQLKLVLLTGICGGVPNTGTDEEILLGDVVIGKAIIHYDYGRQYPDGFVIKDTIEDRPGRHPKDIRNFLAPFGTHSVREQLEKRTVHFLEQLQHMAAGKRQCPNYHHPGTVHDVLFPSGFRHKHHIYPRCICADFHASSDPVCEESRQLSCDQLGCDKKHSVARRRLDMKKNLEARGKSKEAQAPSIFFGRIGSGNKVIKSGEDRDKIARSSGILAFEMEGAGVWDEVPCVIVKGVCDYADSHKRKTWQHFAAATAACTMKAVLERYNQTDKPPSCSYIARPLQLQAQSIPSDQFNPNNSLRRKTPSGIIEGSYDGSVIQPLSSPKRTKHLRSEMYGRDFESSQGNGTHCPGNETGNHPNGLQPSSTGHGEEGISKIDSATKQALLELLYFSKIDERITNLKPAQGNTCRWFLNKPEYINWYNNALIQENGGFLWIKGKPGTGKSTLMKLLFGEAQSKARHGGEKVVLSFFFLARGTVEEKSSTGLYRALLHQLLQRLPDLEESLEWLAADGARVIQRSGWSEEALKQTLMHAVQGLGDRSLMVFIDALDECDDRQAKDMIGFLEELCVLTTKLQICFSSRHYPHIEINDGIELILEMEEGHRDDIQHYIKSKLRLRKTKQAESLQLDILNKSCRIFLWVVLVIDLLNTEYPNKPVDKMRKRLKEIPERLSDLFQMIITRDGNNLDQLDVCFKWILFATRPLQPEELYFAIQLGLDKDCSTYWDKENVELVDMKTFVESSSKGLAEVTRNKASEVQFIHESVRDFLLAKYEDQSPQFSGSFAGYSHEALRDCCLAQINSQISHYVEIPDPLPDAPKTAQLRNALGSRFPFLAYATLYVFHHSDNAQREGVGQADFIASFPLQRWILINNALERYTIRRYKTSVSPLYIFGEKNLANLIRIFPNKNSCFDAEDERYGPPIFAARATGSDKAVTAFLEYEAKSYPPEATIHDFLKQQPPIGSAPVTNFGREFTFLPKKGLLFHIIEEGDELLIHFLRALERLYREWDSTKFEFQESMLTRAMDQNRLHIVRVLLEAGIYSRLEQIGPALLLHAIKARSEPMFKMILDAGLDLNSNPIRLNHLLHIAIHVGCEPIVRALIVAGADTNFKNTTGKTPLYNAISSKSEPIIKALLEAGADTDLKNNEWMLLCHAISTGSVVTIKALFEAGVDINLRHTNKQTPLHCAASVGSEATFKLLLELGIDPDAKDDSSCTPLHLAASRGYQGVVRLLTEIDHVDMNSKSISQQTPLSVAACRGNEEVVRLLLETGKVDVNTQDNEGDTPLLLAAQKGHDTIAKLLLMDDKIDCDLQNVYGRTPLSWAAQNGSEATVKLLLNDSRVDPNITDHYGQTPYDYGKAWSHVHDDVNTIPRLFEVHISRTCA